MALSRFVVGTQVTLAWVPAWSEVVNQAPAPPVTTPSVPATTVAQDNANRSR